MDTLVSGDWLEQQLGDPGLVVLDCSVIVDMETGETSSGRAEYEAGHIPSAAFADLTGDLCDRQSSIQWALPPPEQFCAALGELGVGDDSRVVLYDGSMSFWAARVWCICAPASRVVRNSICTPGCPGASCRPKMRCCGSRSTLPRHLCFLSKLNNPRQETI